MSASEDIGVVIAELATIEDAVAVLETGNAELAAEVATLTADNAALQAALDECEGGEPEPVTEFYLMSSRISDRANPQKLVTVSSLAGNAYIFLAKFIDGVMADDETEIASVTFYIDSVQKRVEATAPYDLAGGTATIANPFDTTTLTDGPHQFSALLMGIDAVVAETVTIKNTTTTPPPDPPPTDVWNPSWANLWGPRANAIPAVPAGTPRVDTLAEIAAIPAGGKMVVTGGFTGQTLPFKDGQTIWLGEPGSPKVVIDGAMKKILAWPIRKQMTVYGGRITNYWGVDSSGQVSSDARTWAIIGEQMTLVAVEFDHMKMGAVRLRNGSKLSSCVGHHNPMYDFAGASNCVIEHCDLGEGSGDADGQGGNRGTNKTAVADKCVYRYNRVHDTFGNGLWSDINNTNHEWFRNLLEDVAHAAIFLEVSCAGNKIVQNTIRRSGKQKNPEVANYPGGAALQVSATPGTLVDGNTFEDCPWVAIALFQAHQTHEQWKNPGKGWTWKCCLGVRDSLVTNNWIRGANQVAMTLTGNLPPPEDRDPAHRCGQKDIIDPASNNRFENNHYPATAKFMYDEKTISRAEWESHGFS